MGAGSPGTREPRLGRGAGGPRGTARPVLPYPHRPHSVPFILLRDGSLSRVAFPQWILRDQRPQTPSRPAWPKASLLHVGRQVSPSRQQLLLSGEFSGSQGTRKQRPAVAWAGPAPAPQGPSCTPMPRGSPGAVLPSHTLRGGEGGMQWQQITLAKNWMIMPAAVTCSGHDRGAGRKEGGLLRAPEAR